jgi:hypothetical protein
VSFDKQWWDKFRRDEVDSILFGVHPLTGVCIRMQDKFQRAKAFCLDGQLKVSTNGDQSKDIFRDLIGYSLIAIGMLERAEKE